MVVVLGRRISTGVAGAKDVAPAATVAALEQKRVTADVHGG